MTETTPPTLSPAQIQQKREALLRRAREEHARLEAVLDTMSQAEQTQTGVTDGWSIKDHLAHLTWWEQRVITMLGGAPDPIDAIPGEEKSEDDINAFVCAQNRERSLTDVRAAFDASYQQMLHLIQAVPDDVFVARHDWISGNSDHHYDEHRRMIEAWRDRAAGKSSGATA